MYRKELICIVLKLGRMLGSQLAQARTQPTPFGVPDRHSPQSAVGSGEVTHHVGRTGWNSNLPISKNKGAEGFLGGEGKV